MPIVTLDGERYPLDDGETVLECLLRHKIAIPNSCRSGLCQSCLMQRLQGEIPASAQQGLRASLQENGCFLACMARPATDVKVGWPGEDARPLIPAAVVGHAMAAPDVVCLRLRPEKEFVYRAGQFLQLHRADGLARSYSLASLPSDPFLELHIRCFEGGSMSEWVRNCLCTGMRLAITGPSGDCCYDPHEPDRPLLLIGTGTGLAPLYGIVRDALHCGHQAPIALYHGSREPAGLYLTEALRALAKEHRNFHYVRCLSGGSDLGCVSGRADQAAFAQHGVLKGWSVFLCGHPEMVKSARRKAYLLGAALPDIHADAFVRAAG